MFAYAQGNLAALMPREDETPLEYWLSYSPVAPFFGVAWRFGTVRMPGMEGLAAPRERARSNRKPKADAVAEKAVVVTAPVAAAITPDPAPAKPDDLSVIKGIGPKMVEKLNENGVTTYAQIAAWTDADVSRMGEVLGGIPGAIERADWVGQARELA